MKRSSLFKIIFLAVFSLNHTLVRADDPTPTPTASPTPTPAACDLAQDCIDSAVAASVASCVEQNSCSPQSKFGSDPFALSAGILADRAVELRKCSTKTTRVGCNVCYELAAAPLKFRYDGPLFHGLLFQAIHQIRENKRSVCSALPK